MDIDDRSGVLFGRYQAMRIYLAIGRLPKPAFTTGDIVKLSGAPSTQCSKELDRLSELSLLRRTSRRGAFERDDTTSFWECMDRLADEWAGG